MHDPTCNRRDFLKLTPGFGPSFMLPLTLPSLNPKTAVQRGPNRPKSLLILWLSGGPSQLETWDPHPGTPIGGPTESIDTTIPGVKIAEHFPQLAEQLYHLSLIRSLVSKEGDH